MELWLLDFPAMDFQFLGGKWTIDHLSDVEDSFKIDQIL